jgi:hypothetical protein
MARRWGVRRFSRARNAVVTCLAVTAAVALLSACGTRVPRTTSSPNPPPSTQGALPAVLQTASSAPTGPPVMKQFAPYDESGRATAPVEPGGTASCFASSIAVPVSGVYRCLSANTILDPCFASVVETVPATLACFSDPWSAGRLVTLSGRLPAYDPVLRQGDPWAIELSNGARCVSVTGAIPVLGDVALSYRCGTSSVAGITSNADGTVVAHYGPSSGPLVDNPVTVEWRGRSYRLAGTP